MTEALRPPVRVAVFGSECVKTFAMSARKFISALLAGLLAQFAREPISGDLPIAIERPYSIRETIIS